jgi:nucleotide-binding universal stress UspA family protein
MDKLATVLVPFDFSGASKKALDYAVNFIGKNKGMKVVLAYVSENQNTAIPEKDLDKTVKKYDLNGRMEWVSASGTLIAALINIQKKRQIDLVIMGTSGVTDEKVQSETHTSTLVLEADCPVLVVPYNDKKFKIKHIALVLGKEKIDDTETLNTLLDVARKFNAKVHVVTIENKPESYGYSNIDVENENALAYYLENFYEDHTFIKNPDVVEGIFSYVSKKDIDMITILPRNHAKKSEPSEGQLTQVLTQRSQVPVLAID